MELISRIEADPDFAKGLQHVSSNELDDAINTLGALYGRTVEVEGDLGTSVAPVAFVYGDANLRLGVQSNEALVSMEVKKKQKQDAKLMKTSGGSTSVEGKEEEDEEEEEAEVLEREEVDEIFQISFESLDTSRLIYERLISQETDQETRKMLKIRLGNVMMRLGDLKFEQQILLESLEEYKTCLKIRLEVEESDSRAIASTYSYMALAEEGMALEKPQELGHWVDAVVYLSQAQHALSLRRQKLTSIEAPVSVSEEPSSGSKKKVTKSKNWIENLSSENVAALERACSFSTQAMSHNSIATDNAEAKDLGEMISEIADKIDDLTYYLTVEGQVEERKAREEQLNQTKADETESQAAALSDKPTSHVSTGEMSTIGFGSENAAGADNKPGQASDAVKVQAPLNILQPRKREKLITPIN